MEDSQTVRIELDSHSQSPTVVRSAVVGLSEAAALEPSLVDDLRTAISEACNNVVQHAYGDRTGPLSVYLSASPDAVEACVRDAGGGIQNLTAAAEHTGVGLAVMAALADTAEFQDRPEGGTVVRLHFRRASVNGAVPRKAPSMPAQPLPISGDVVVQVAPAGALRFVLWRVARALATLAHFSIDRFADLAAVSALICDQVERSANGAITFSITSSLHKLEFQVGPFTSGTLSGAAAAGELETLGRLSHEHDVATADDAELLRLSMIDGAPPRAEFAARGPG